VVVRITEAVMLRGSVTAKRKLQRKFDKQGFDPNEGKILVEGGNKIYFGAEGLRFS
jgi:hypothetical protein